MRAASISVLPGQCYGNARVTRHYQSSAWNTSFLGKNANLQQDVFVKSQPDYFKAKSVSFKGTYNRQDAENLIDRINGKQAESNGKGFQSEYYKINEEFGLKAPNPQVKGIFADINGVNNIKEYEILKRMQGIDPDIAVKPVDLINKYGKHYLVMEHLSGAHPFDSKLNQDNLSDIMKKAFKMDTNGIVHSDLQSGNIILAADNKAKFIDFGSFSILQNNGSYISSDCFDGNHIKHSVNTNSPLIDKFRAVFYNNSPVLDIKNHSDNPHLNIKSNASNFEFRTIYDYIKHDRAENPKQFFADYLKVKSVDYHTPMVEFLEKMDMSPNDIAQSSQKQKALDAERVFKNVFAAPSENVAKTELGKIQLKWLINDYQGAHTKAFDYFNKLINQTREYAQNAEGMEKDYFELVAKRLDSFTEMLKDSKYQGDVLEEKDDVVKKVFDKITQKIEEKTEKIVEMTTKKAEQPMSKAALFNKKNIFIALGVAAVAACGVCLNKSLKSKHANMS